jgi:hypothetical protein
VVVSAKKAGSKVMVSVISDAQGRYSFPANRLSAGKYSLKIRAIGYDLEGPATADVADEQTATVDLKLRKTKKLAAQMSNAEWMMSLPGAEDQKAFLLNCVGCHTLERIVRSSHDADEWMQVMVRMSGYGPVSQPIKPQRMLDPARAIPSSTASRPNISPASISARPRSGNTRSRPCRVRPGERRA